MHSQQQAAATAPPRDVTFQQTVPIKVLNHQCKDLQVFCHFCCYVCFWVCFFFFLELCNVDQETFIKPFLEPSHQMLSCLLSIRARGVKEPNYRLHFVNFCNFLLVGGNCLWFFSCIVSWAQPVRDLLFLFFLSIAFVSFVFCSTAPVNSFWILIVFCNFGRVMNWRIDELIDWLKGCLFLIV